MRSIGRNALWLWLFAGIWACAGACAGTDEVISKPDSPSKAGTGGAKGSPAPSGEGAAGGSGTFFPPDSGFFDPDASHVAVVISPGDTEITLDPSDPLPQVKFSATGIAGRRTTWFITNPGLGSVGEDGTFTASGRIGGEAEIQIREGGRVIASVRIVVNIVRVQNGGDEPRSDAGTNAVGGLGGVGGEGLGVAVSDDLKRTLSGSPAADDSFRLLYPYDDTVFPLGILPPLLQWTNGAPADVDGVMVRVRAPHYDYKGYFAKPPLLAADRPFDHHPIPHDVWRGATETAAGGTLDVSITISAKGKAYGPVTQHYKVALAPFRGVIYYQSYGTKLVKNFNAYWGGRTGGATLSIRAGEERPSLVAGKTTDDDSGCRVCHSVSARGDFMVVQHGDQYLNSSLYDLNNGRTESSSQYDPGTVGWIGLTPDGTLGLANSINVNAYPPSNQGDTHLYDVKTGKVVESPGLAEFVTQTVLPAFSPDGKHVAFGLHAGPSTPEVGPAAGQLVAMDFEPSTRTFSNPIKLWAPESGAVAFSTFTPDGKHVVAQRRWDGRGDYSSTDGAHSELWWIDLATQTPTRLDVANGLGEGGKAYVPRGPNNHDQDELLNFEPSISPVAAGGYAWMVFMSRRLYGNVATRDPWDSHAEANDLGTDPTTKKIWMAAIDLDAKPGVDPSHPAFYIPGQELLGVNSRPFLVLDPCVTDRGTCTTGIDCCSGFCRDGLCQTPPAEERCSNVDERCSKDDDCCDTSATCIGGFCAKILR